MTIQPPTPLGQALARAVHQVRARISADIGPGFAPKIVIITPSEANGGFARQQLALATNFIRVEFLTPERLIHALAGRRLASQGLRAEPSAWRNATVGDLVRSLEQSGELEPHAEVLSQPGWTRALARATETLETAGVEPEALERVGDSAHADRLRILATLLRGVARQRSVDRLYSNAELTQAALAGIEASPWKGAVVLGDRLLAPQVYAVLQAWFTQHPHVEVRTQPWHNLAPAASGLRASLGTDDSIDVRLASDSALAGLAKGLFAAPDQAIVQVDHDKSLTLARTSDEVRELGEATRVVIDAIRAGTALDRIAVVVPDAEQVVTLHEQFDQLGIPATYLVGPPLATTPAASFLLSCLELASGEDTVPAWYALLRQPGLRLGAANSSQGRGRWRRVLARCGAVRSTGVIVDAVQAWAAGIGKDAHDPEGDRRSAQNLVRAIESLNAVFQHFRRPSTLGAHAQRWSDFLLRWWTPSPDRARVCQLLRSWGPGGIGASIPLDAALAELRTSLQASPALHGRLSDQAVRVLTPMGLLGGAFELVVVTGLSEGRLPRRPSEDPILPDALISRINADCGVQLLDSHAIGDYEVRRFAAIVGSCSKHLWLSSPATELLEARPLLPSSFLLEVASIMTGGRASYADLAGSQAHVGSRARPWSSDPQRAVSALEHRITSTVADPQAGLRRLALHPTARRQLGLQRALDQVVPTRWTGLLTPGILAIPGLDGAPIEPRKLAKLVANPGAFLVEEVLGVRRPPQLYGRSDPLSPDFQDRLLLAALREALDTQGPIAPAFAAAWETAATQWRRYRSDVDDAAVELLRAIAGQRFTKLERIGALPRGIREPAQGRPVAQLAWVVETQLGWREDNELVDIRASKPARGQLARDVPELVLTAMVQPSVTKLRAIALDGTVTQGERATEAAALTRRLVVATRCVAHQGWWPWGGTHDLRLSGEGDVGYLHGESVPVPARRPA